METISQYQTVTAQLSLCLCSPHYFILSLRNTVLAETVREQLR